jgi:hypothetical protein
MQPALRTIQRTRDLQRALSDPEVSLTDARPQVRFTQLGDGHEITGRIAGAVHDEATDRAHLLVEGTDGLLHVVPQTGGIARRRGAGGLPTGTIVTLRGRGFDRDGRAGVAIEAEEHGRLEELRQAAEPNTVLDREVLDLVRPGSAAEVPGAARSRFSEAWREARRERIDLLVRAGLLDEEERERAYTLSRGADARVDARTQGRELTPLGQLRAQAGKPVREAPDRPGQVLRGELRAVAVDEQGRRLAVLDTGRQLTAVPTAASELQVGHEYEARSSHERRADERRVLTWQFEDLERTHKRAVEHTR